MSTWQLANYGAWVASALIFFWLIRDFLKINEDYDEKVLLNLHEPDEEMEFVDKGVSANE